MSIARRVSATASVLLVVCLAGSIATLRQLDRIRTGATLQDVLYISSPKTLKRLSLGYDGLLADIYWTRAVQYFGGNHSQGTGRYALLAPLLEITTGLDPHLIVAYDFGANFLAAKPPLGAGEPDRAIGLTQFGIHNNPQNWQLYRNLGFIYYLDLKDYPNAADAFARASSLPNAHPFMKVMAAQMAQHAGEISTARMLWTAVYESTKDRDIRANASAHLRALRVDQDVTILEDILKRYREKTGHFPYSYAELISARTLPGVPIDPLGNPYKLVSGGRIEVRDPDNFPFIEKGVPVSYIPPPKPKFLPSDY
jgi:tetratricopeptide (TPR) repeat protein